jgi:hypothetical protein
VSPSTGVLWSRVPKGLHLVGDPRCGNHLQRSSPGHGALHGRRHIQDSRGREDSGNWRGDAPHVSREPEEDIHRGNGDSHSSRHLWGPGPKASPRSSGQSPFMDENRKRGLGIPLGPLGHVSPMECFEDLNGDGIWSPENEGHPFPSGRMRLEGSLCQKGEVGLPPSTSIRKKGYRLEEFSVSGDKKHVGL